MKENSEGKDPAGSFRLPPACCFGSFLVAIYDTTTTTPPLPSAITVVESNDAFSGSRVAYIGNVQSASFQSRSVPGKQQQEPVSRHPESESGQPGAFIYSAVLPGLAGREEGRWRRRVRLAIIIIVTTSASGTTIFETKTRQEQEVPVVG